mgnify:CR=1 FL=1
MNLSSDTVAVLKNFSDINQNILVKPGNKIQTISTMKNILAEAEVSEKFEDEFAIYDLPEFLRSLSSITPYFRFFPCNEIIFRPVLISISSSITRMFFIL